MMRSYFERTLLCQFLLSHCVFPVDMLPAMATASNALPLECYLAGLAQEKVVNWFRMPAVQNAQTPYNMLSECLCSGNTLSVI